MKFLYENLPVTKRGKWTKSVMEFSKIAKELIKDEDVVMLKASNEVGLNRLLVEFKAMGVPN
jgi:UDP-N-acetylmuramyl pentapeptide synthase